MTAKGLVKAALKRLGLSLTWYPPPHSLSRHVKDFIRDDVINLVLDVGAFHGEYCRMLRKEAGYTGVIASFEPCAESFRILSAQMTGDRDWHGYPFGLSDTDSAALLNTYSDKGDFNSVLRLRTEAARAYKVDTGSASTEPIQLRKIDTIWADITTGIESPRVFMKIDTQGHDTAVVRGAAAHLQYIHGVQSELPAVEIYDGMTSMPTALELYRQLGYVAVGFYPINTPEAYGVSPEFDVILKRFRR